MNPALLQQQIQLPYSRDTWRPVLRDLLPNLDLFAQVVPSPLTNEREREIATARRQFGRATLADGKIIALYEIDVVPAGVDLLRNRVALRQLIARCIDQVSAHAVLAFFAQPGVAHYRLTYAARESTLDLETLALTTHETATRRFTYVLGPGETHRTAAVRLAGLAEKRAAATLADVTYAFSVERLNKEFFDTYRTHYGRFCEHLLAGDAPARVFGLLLDGLEGKARDRALKPVRDFVKKLLGRLVFLHFLQKKGWLGCPALPPAQETLPQESVPWTGGQPDFLRELFAHAPTAEQDRFHSARLVPLFFDTLNDPRRPGHRYAISGTRVPYLNGGLFERDFAGVERLDFPGALFRDLLDFFGQYHFTIDENDPEDHEIGIDPEMLGHIFENLLEDNKDKGAYYTPKAVVQYMARQSLIHALAGRFPDDPAARGEIESLIRRKEPIDTRQTDAWLTRHATRLAEILDGLKICDPAIGSGAFPIGLLQEIYWTRLTLNPALDRATAKRSIIQNSIHGVDLDAGAVEIARLRFWLALVVDERVPVPLPNLDYQIMQGNSLLESFEGERLDTLTEPMRYGRTRLGSAEVELDLGTAANVTGGELAVTVHTPAQHGLAELQRRYFACHDPAAKAGLRAEIDAAVLRAVDARLTLRREELEASLRSQAAFTGRAHVRGEEKQRAAMQAELDALAGKSERLRALLADPRAERPFFLWHLWFWEVFVQNNGFDIVIANPPYLKERDNKSVFNLVMSSEWGDQHHEGKMDYWFYFLHTALDKTNSGGVIAFITSRYWLKSSGARKLIHRIATDGSLTEIVDFGHLPVFEEVEGHHMLHFYHRSHAARTSRITQLHIRVTDLGQNLGPYRMTSIDRDHGDLFSASNEIVLYPTSVTLIANSTVREHFEVGQGVVQNPDRVSTVSARRYNLPQGLGVFVLDESELAALRLSEAELRFVKPFYNESAVERYGLRREQQRFLIYTTKRNCASLDALPNLAAHLIRFRRIMDSRRETQTGLIEWFHLHWPRNPAYFEGPRVVLPSMFTVPSASYLEEPAYFGMGSNVVTGGSSTFSLKVLCALLNSSIGYYWFNHHGKKRGAGVDVGVDRLRSFPLPNSTDHNDAVALLVDRILAAKRTNDTAAVTSLEADIDTHVFRLYGLTPEEIQLVRDARA